MISYSHKYQVRRRLDAGGNLPIDMLRYDHSSPHTAQDSTLIEADEAGPITLSRIAERGWQPAWQRWESFGWEVVPGSSEIARLP